MPTDLDPAQRAARAAALRLLATRLEACDVDRPARWAGTDTWIGPTADACRADLVAHATAVAGAIAWLRARARQLDVAG